MISKRNAPVMRLQIRDAVWTVRRVDQTSGDDCTLSAIGVSEIVRGRESAFLSPAESEIMVLDPAKAELVANDSPGNVRTHLALEKPPHKTPPTGTAHCLDPRDAMDVLPIQRVPARKALQQPCLRILITDTLGLGKIPRKAVRTDRSTARILPYGHKTTKPLGWEFVRHLSAGHEVTRVVTDNTLGTGPIKQKIEFHAPFSRHLREVSYLEVWAKLGLSLS